MNKTDLEAQPDLHYSVFDDVIDYLRKQKVMAPSYVPAGKDGAYPSGTDGWFMTLAVLRGRGWSNIALPWALVTINAIWWTVFMKNIGEIDAPEFNTWKSVYQLGISTTLSFLLTFRLNRAILRFWEGMKAWGNIVVNAKSLASGILAHGRDEPKLRDRAIVWTTATCIAAKAQIRGVTLGYEQLKGILTEEEVEKVSQSCNPSLYAADEVRHYLKYMLDVVNPARASETRQLEGKLDSIIANIGTTEIIIDTPLPLVYVSNLRTFLLIYLLSLPYVTWESWGWMTIPVVSITGLLFLSIDGASMEVENPFEKGMVNDLDLDHYCRIILEDVQMLVKKTNERDGVLSREKGQAA
mmetsp:Transcript_38389/g.44734  ORF Transcript_38389/g.44734 Transcript_38389/m.44734 type:complete len:354 (-) Transcript_38389:65-1126(-)|eukprot:CAMPEP_0194439400 /NCGR_PEP_ID=MMETSP0176-20130528/110377_1 /TAXON_ID=216777 /ORGANISM="Proboscia alata, Strain PI-D3" /LENGTH=353 /DNA_ID=CAMNT_0039262589 /DNA_START=58 /DNA_END=1119 /DNA_ORIENTATION=-